MGDSDELAQIRQRRMAEMQAMQGGGGDRQKQQQEKMEQMENMKNGILSQVLDQEARARLNTIKLTKPEKGQQVEAMLCQMAQTGQLGGKMTESDLKNLLERMSAGQAANKVKFDRRRAMDSDDDDDLEGL